MDNDYTSQIRHLQNQVDDRENEICDLNDQLRSLRQSYAELRDELDRTALAGWSRTRPNRR